MARDFEEEFLRAREPEAWENSAQQLASLEAPEGIQALNRLFTRAQNYRQRVALIGALADSHSDATLATKLAILQTAMAPAQARQVRSAALDVALQLDDPRALALIRRAAKEDPDSQIRELARTALEK